MISWIWIPNMHFSLPVFSTSLAKNISQRKPAEFSEISSVDISAPLKWHQITVYNYLRCRHSGVSLGICGTQLRVISEAPAGVDTNRWHRLPRSVYYSLSAVANKSSAFFLSEMRFQGEKALNGRMSTVKIKNGQEISCGSVKIAARGSLSQCIISSPQM